MSRTDDDIIRTANEFYDKGDYLAAASHYEEVAAKGNVDAQLFLASMYLAGQGVERNVDVASAWLRQADSLGSPEAAFRLGMLAREEGRYADALYWLTKAADNGHMPALHRVGWVYLKGEGVPSDRQTAYAFFERAAAEGHIHARLLVAVNKIKGRRGLSQIWQGIREYVTATQKLARILDENPGDDRLR